MHAPYLSVAETLNNHDNTVQSLRVTGFATLMSERGTNLRSLTFQAGNFDHYTRVPAL